MNNMLEYNGYHAKIEFDADDRVFVGEVFGIVDSLNFYGTNIEELTDAFHTCIDDYLQMCKEYDKEPDREFKGSFNIRVTPEIHRQAALAAARQGITLNQYVANAIDQSFNPVSKSETVVYMMPTERIGGYFEQSKSQDFKAGVPINYHISEVISIGQ